MQTAYSDLAGGQSNFIDGDNIRIGLAFTEDSGKTWKRMVVTPAIAKLLGHETTEDQNWVEPDLMICFLDKKRGWLSPRSRGNHSTWQTEDGGYTWVKIFNVKCFWSFFLADKKHGWFFAVNNKGINFVISTNDGGNTWAKHKIKVPKLGAIAHPYFIDVKTGYAIDVIHPNKEDERISIRGVMKTTDGGHTWKLIWLSPDPDERYLGLRFIDEHEGWIWSALPDSIYHTTDSGKSWGKNKKYSHLRPESMYFINRNNGWLLSLSVPDKTITSDNINEDGGFPSLFSTLDGGKTWRKISSEEVLNNSNLYFGPKLYFPNWNEGNMFLFWLKMEYLKNKKK